ncbi:histidine phosphatase family protein [Dactylosporangium roseum]|uniref:Histidine phosphatase family protein n=1 Tax=Dactylosporangium roseum TaxID=47989 RepID=A0ABY5Z3Q4_9ACTN|nr:histidine phosphatase family protein [Dactylosporangium roseum]UWZ35700.1 histidine phosphatase family protein [Dactylosporangium roseum]
MTLLVLWRHGQTEWNVGGRIQGQTDVALSETGVEQVRAAAPRLAALGPTVLISSDLRRAADTQAGLAALVDLPVRYDARLRERSYGDWEGLTHPEITARWPESFARWRRGEPVDDAGVEEVDALSKRVAAALQEAVDAAPEGAVIVATTHGGAARHATCALLGWPVEFAPTLGALHNCHSTLLLYDTVHGWRMAAHNVP